MSRIVNILHLAMTNGLNVLLEGYHGVGKTRMVLDAAAQKELRLKYYSAATLDPWADLVGIPVPVDRKDGAGKELQFVRPADLEGAQIVFFDELNRSHPKVQNAVLEMVQFKSINGQRLPDLRMVWAAANPADDAYSVTALDPALVDRFHICVNVPAAPRVEYYRDKAGIPETVAKALVLWWDRDLSPELKRAISPRRLEHIGLAYMADLPIETAIPPSVKAPIKNLVERIDKTYPFELTRAKLLAQPDEVAQEVRRDANFAMAVADFLKEWPDLLPNCYKLFLVLPSELQATMMRSEKVKTPLLNLVRGNRGDVDLRALADRLRTLDLLR